MREFRIGDRVEFRSGCVCFDNDSINPGDKGTVCYIISHSVGVRWDHPVEHGHGCTGNSDVPHCEDGYGWFVARTQIRLLEPEPEDPEYETIDLEELLRR